MKILITPTSVQKNTKVLKRLEEASLEPVFNPKGRPLEEEELIPLLKNCDGYIAGLDYITDKVLKECRHLRVISRYGAGYDRVDMEAAKRYGITVTNTQGVNAQAVGELALALMFSVARKIPYLDQQTKKGEWTRTTGTELKGKTLGILGLGAIGKVLAGCAVGCGMNVRVYDPYIDEAYCKKFGILSVAMEEILSDSDVISIHMPLTRDTKHLIDSKTIEQMKTGVIIINTSRGGIIDENAALQALEKGKIGGLGLDAFEQEPPGESPLFLFPNVVVTPHTGAHTKEATEGMAERAVDNLLAVLAGKRCDYIVN